MRHELTDGLPFGFPFAATLRGTPRDHTRIDTPVIVQGRAGQERHYYRVELPNRQIVVANDSLLFTDI